MNKNRRQLTFFALFIAIILSALDDSALSPALPKISTTLGDLTGTTQIIVAYLFTTTLATPLYGKLSDMFGRKPLLLVALGIFLISSALSSMSQNVSQLTIFRALQGLGAGGLYVLAMGTLAQLYSVRERGRMGNLITAGDIAASIGGPQIGALMMHFASWRWIFILNIPLTAIAILIVLSIEYPTTPKKTTFDYPGAALLSIAIISVVLLCTYTGPAHGHPSAITFVVTGLTATLASIAFVNREKTAKNPFIPLHLFKKRNMAIACALTAVIGFAAYGPTILLPIFLSTAGNESVSQIAWTMLPITVSLLGTSLLCAARLREYNSYFVISRYSLGVIALGLVALAIATATESRVGISSALALMGFGLGLPTQPLIIIAQSSVHEGDIGAATGCMALSRGIGLLLGSSVFGYLTTRYWGSAQQNFQAPHISNLTSAMNYPRFISSNIFSLMYISAAVIFIGAFAIASFFDRAPIGATTPAEEPAASALTDGHERKSAVQ